MKRCYKCGFEKDATSDNFYKDSSRHDGLENKCKECRKIVDRSRDRDRKNYRKNVWYANPENKRRTIEYNRNYKNEYENEMKLSSRCRSAVYKAIKKGILKRPNKCEWCGKFHEYIDAAHHDYSKPLEVKWLCRSCHNKWDSKEPKLIKR